MSHVVIFQIRSCLVRCTPVCLSISACTPDTPEDILGGGGGVEQTKLQIVSGNCPSDIGNQTS